MADPNPKPFVYMIFAYKLPVAMLPLYLKSQEGPARQTPPPGKNSVAWVAMH